MRVPLPRGIAPSFSPSAGEELDGPNVSGRVQLPTHLDWSTRRKFDLTDPIDRRRVYELVLREGDLEDLRRYVDPRDLAELFDTLVLPEPIRAAWERLLGLRSS
jgi:hypothetical protein